MSEEQQKARITSVTVENFKGIGAPVTIPFKPLTLMFGKNSVGKSTIIEALLLMNDWMQNKGPDLDTVTLGGNAVHLGGFKRFVHGHDLSRNVRIRVDLDLGDNTLPQFREVFEESYDHYLGEYDREDDDRDLEKVDVHNLIDVQDCYIEIIAGRDPRSEEIGFLECNAGVNGEHVVSRKGIGFDHANKLNINDAHPAVKALKKIDPMTRKFLNYHADTQNFRIWVPKFRKFEAIEIGFLDETGWGDFTSAVPFFWDLCVNLRDDYIGQNDAVWKRHRIRSLEKVGSYQYRFISHFISQVLIGNGQLSRTLLKDQIFIGPLRQVPSKIVPLEMSSNWADGSAAWNSLASPEYAQFVLNDSEFKKEVRNERSRLEHRT